MFILLTWVNLFYSFLKDIYALPIALIGAYGIINQYALKMIGGPLGGFLADKVANRQQYISEMDIFIICQIAMAIFIMLPHDSMNAI